VYALEGLDLGASKHTTIQGLQKKIAVAQKKISALQTKLSRTTKIKEQNKLQANILEWQKRLTDYQLQLAQLQAGVAPPATPTTPPTPLDVSLPAPTTLIPWDLAPTTTVQTLPSPAPAVTVETPPVNIFSNPWILGGGLIFLFLVMRR